MDEFTDSGKGRSDTRERIITISSEHFFLHGHRGITMDELAELVGVSKKTLYVYFPTKIAILEAVMDRKFADVFIILDAVRAEHETNCVDCFLSVLARWQEILSYVQPVFWRDIQMDAKRFFESTEARRRKIVHGIFGRIIEDGVKSGDFRGDMAPQLVAEIILASIEGIVRSGKARELGITPKEILLTLVKLMIEGSLTETGREKWSARKAVTTTA